MDIINEFIQKYGAAILSTIVTALASYIGIVIKNLYAKYINDKTKKDVVKVCVRAVEQIFRNLHGADKLNKCVESVSSMLCGKGIKITEFEIRMLIESAVNEFNGSFTDIPAIEEAGDAELEIRTLVDTALSEPDCGYGGENAGRKAGD